MGDGLPTGVVVPALLDRMNDADPVVRLTAHEELKQRTGRDFGFKPWDEPQPRAQAMSQWRTWWGQVTSASARQVSGTGTATTRRATSRPRCALKSHDDPTALDAPDLPRSRLTGGLIPHSRGVGRRVRGNDSMTTTARPIRSSSAPLHAALGVLAYFGGLGLLAVSILRATARPRGTAPPLGRAVLRQLDDLFSYGLPLIALVCVPMGAFLSMQAFFHATFTEAVGAVVGLGLVRNLAPLLAGMVLTAILALRIVPELRLGDRAALDDDTHALPDRDVVLGIRPDDRPETEPARLAAVRVIAAAIAGPVLSIWGA